MGGGSNNLEGRGGREEELFFRKHVGGTNQKTTPHGADDNFPGTHLTTTKWLLAQPGSIFGFFPACGSSPVQVFDQKRHSKFEPSINVLDLFKYSSREDCLSRSELLIFPMHGANLDYFFWSKTWTE